MFESSFDVILVTYWDPLSYHHPQPALWTVLSRTCKSQRLWWTVWSQDSLGATCSGILKKTYIPPFRPAGKMGFSLIFSDIIFYQLFENSVEGIFIKFPDFHTLTRSYPPQPLQCLPTLIFLIFFVRIPEDKIHKHLSSPFPGNTDSPAILIVQVCLY